MTTRYIPPSVKAVQVLLVLSMMISTTALTVPTSTFTSSFTTTTPTYHHYKTTRSANNHRLEMVVDRLSQPCVQALATAHAIGNEFGLRVLKNEVITAGLIQYPEKAIRTLVKYNVQYPSLLKSSASEVLTSNGFIIQRKINRDTMSSDSGKPLPFGEETKIMLSQAGKIADYFDASEVSSEHVLLSLMGYNFGKPLDLENIPVGYRVLVNSESAFDMNSKSDDDDDDGPKKAKFSAYQFCEDLVQDMSTKYDWQREQEIAARQAAPTNTNNGEVIVIGGDTAGGSNTLAEVGVDLTERAMDGDLDLVFGRSDEIKMAMRTLGRRRKNNPCLIGDPGVGKTAIAEAIAQVIATSYVKKDKGSKGLKLPKFKNPFSKGNDGDDDVMTEQMDPIDEILASDSYPPCPPALDGFRVISVDLAALVAGTRNRGDFEEKVKNLISEASNKNIILFIDEVHNLIGTGGGGDGAMNAANLLKPALARGELRVLGATTTPEYRKYIEKDAALERRFQPLQVNEPSVEETLQILQTLVPRYAEYHGVEYTPNALEAAVKLSDRYIMDRFLPDKAIDLMDESGSMVKMSDNFEEDYFVTEDAINTVISELTNIPIGRLDVNSKVQLQNLELDIGKRIKGQSRAVKAIAKAIRRARAGMRDPKRPTSSFLFCGPTGVGKTEVCKSLADTYYGREKDMITIDMSEYMDRFSLSRLVGAPPGYVGYEEGGQLTEAVRRNPHSVILFDEIEKAHEDILNVLLQIMDEGKLTDGKGRKVSFKNTIFVMTSNIGSKKIVDFTKQAGGVESTTEEQSVSLTRLVKDELEKAWKPEILNRIDEIVVFNPLSTENLREIATNILDETAKRAGEAQDIVLDVSDDVAMAVTRDGMEYASQYGARPIRRAAQRYLEDTMSEAIMKDFVVEGDEVSVEMAPAKKTRSMNLLDGQDVVQITKSSPTGGKTETMLVPVDLESGIGGSVQNDLEWKKWKDLFDDNDSSKPTEDDPSFQ